jgi:RHS repeat-associated protein
MFTVQWQPSDGSWELRDSSGQVLQQKKLYRFTVPGKGMGDAGALAKSMRPALLRRGTDISSSEASLKVTADGVYDAGYGRYYALKTSGSETVVTGIGNQWSLLVNDNSLFFFVDGQLVFNHVSEAPVRGKATLFASNKISLEWLLTCFDNQVVFTSINAAGNDIQSQLLENTRLTVVENLYDSLGRIVAYTKPAFVTSDEAPLFQYFGDFASYNPDDGSMSGFIADYYPADGGYPYFGTRYEASPLGRVVESSMPGADYKMGTHTQRTAYGANDGSLGLPGGEFFQTTVIDQNDHLSYSLADKRGQQVRKLSQKSTDEEIVAAAFYDDAGNTVELRSPNYREDDPAKDNWVTRLTYNFIGQLTGSSSSTTGEITMIYDRANRLRFRQDAEGASAGNYQYYKYDSAGRIVETGYVTGTWDAPQLQQKADDDPAYPATPDTWRTKTFYDYNGSGEPFQIGQVVKTLTHASDGGTPDVEEGFSYDIFGNVKSRSQIVSAFDDNEYTTGFAYNNLGGITRIDYPVGQAGDPLSIFYEYNCIGQITGIGNQAAQPDNLASYSYNPSGKPIEETLNKYAAGTLKRSYTYDSPVWLEQIQDMNGQLELFHETLKTAAGGQGPAYYNGQAAEMSFRYPQDLSPSATYTNWYNGINALEQVDEARGTNAPLTRKYGFDANGNFDAVDVGASTYQYLAEPDKGNRLQSVRDKNDDSLVFGFESNLNGAVSRYTASGKGSTPPGDLGFTYDAGTRMTSAVTDNREGKTFHLFYGSSGDRVLKQERSGASLTASSLYVNSLSGNTLVKVTTSGNSTRFTARVYGPAGIVAFLRDGSLYNTLKDHLGSVRIILDDAAAVVAAYDYDSYGNVSVLREPEPGFFPYLYCSQELDLELGIYNYKARFYFSTVGRFGAPDSYNQFYSPYIYAGNSPLIYIDPSGNFSIGNFFSAIGGAIIGAFEILIGVAIDAVAGVLEVVTGGLATPVSVGLGMLAGAFIGSGVSAVTYSAAGLITNDFSWKDYGINTAIGFVAGAITAGFGAVGAVAAEAATGVKAAAEAGEAVSTLAKVANTAIKGGFTVAGAEVSATTSTVIGNAANGRSLPTGLGEALVKGVLSSTVSFALPGLDYKAGWGNLLKRVASNVAKSEAIGVTIQLGSNAIHGASMDTGLLNTVVGGVVGGSIGALKTKDFAQDYTKKSLNFMNFGDQQSQGRPPADGIIRLGA